MCVHAPQLWVGSHVGGLHVGGHTTDSAPHLHQRTGRAEPGVQTLGQLNTVHGAVGGPKGARAVRKIHVMVEEHLAASHVGLAWQLVIQGKASVWDS